LWFQKGRKPASIEKSGLFYFLSLLSIGVQRREGGAEREDLIFRHPMSGIRNT